MEALPHGSPHRNPGSAPPRSLLGVALAPRLALAGLLAAGVWGVIAWAIGA
ncbi:hypothetical protein M446_5386 [Methylobacterium sp. 4-46]|uniref:hypothetical protein n=1 Tax=unclassified Methylobacterium TaxID=2615210 RepID=UPI000165CCAD|nr:MULTISPECIES: hypothetical protein [Methylobacterium]ACA19702.1 hypothetical protein M446_5386 [Methylobacterium sp. 4-46]WFT78898.1 hypothetical protein QA634_27135 [Methylobacterium nodulans]